MRYGYGYIGDTKVCYYTYCKNAHAAVAGYPVLTRDTQRYASYFSGVSLVSPAPGTNKQ